MNDQKTTSTQNKLFNSLNKLCLKYRFFIISSNILKISSLGIILISFFLFVSLFIPTLETFTVIITIFITSVSVVILLLITIPKILTNKVINTIDRLLKGEHRFITAWELRNTKHDLANFQAQNAMAFLKLFNANSKIRLLPKPLTTIFFVLSITSLLSFSWWDSPDNLTNQQFHSRNERNNQINTTELQNLLNSTEKNNATSLASENSVDKILKETIDKLDHATSERETIKSISQAIESLEKIEQTTLDKNKFEELTSQINNEQLNQILTKLQSNTLNYEAKKNLLKEQIQQWPDTTLKSNFKPNKESSSLDATTTLFENILNMLNKDNKNISNDSIENILKEIEKMTSENIQENTRDSLEILEALRKNLLKNEITLSNSTAGNQSTINNKNIAGSPETIPDPKGDTLVIQNKTIDNNISKTNYTSQETSHTNKEILNTQKSQIKKTYEEQARMYINKHSIPDKYHNLILEYFMRLSEKSS